MEQSKQMNNMDLHGNRIQQKMESKLRKIMKMYTPEELQFQLWGWSKCFFLYKLVAKL